MILRDDMKITESFDKEEFSCKCGCGLDYIQDGIVQRLQVVRDILKSPILVLSGVRCAKHNSEVGGAPESYHTKGMAVDWVIENSSTLKWAAETILHNWSGGFHYYPEKNFVHCDLGPRRRWGES